MIKIAVFAVVVALAQQATAEKFESLFNGRDLTGWDGNPDLWSVEDGAITGKTTAEAPLKFNTFLIWKGEPLEDFQLELQYRIVDGNSGIQYRSRVIDASKWVVGGYQADIEAGKKYTGILYEEKGRGILTLRGERVVIAADGKKTKTSFAKTEDLQKKIVSEDWNDYLIEARGNVLKHTINGQLMSETDDAETAKRSAAGVLALQVHQGPPMIVQFRAIRLKRLND
ncbi:MAG: DUF1080 domain-containing protein [Planctomycetes bacterium]|nr:DUF1080 domain-containing protein [Planctomycetota bacterium]